MADAGLSPGVEVIDDAAAAKDTTAQTASAQLSDEQMQIITQKREQVRAGLLVGCFPVLLVLLFLV